MGVDKVMTKFIILYPPLLISRTVNGRPFKFYTELGTEEKNKMFT